MKCTQNIFSIALLALTFSNISAQGTKQSLIIENIKGKKGNLMIGWYNSEANYKDKNNPVYKKIVAVDQQKEITVTFDNIPAGRYAVSLFFDENGNKKMDTNFLGIPKEQYGFSNNIIPATRAAHFSEAVFEVKDAPMRIPIRLK